MSLPNTDSNIRYDFQFLNIVKVKDNPSGDFRRMYRHMSKGSWTFSDQDQGLQLSDCTAEALKVTNFV